MPSPPASETAASQPPEAILRQMLYGALLQKSLCVAAELGVADLLANGPRTTAELAAETHTHEPSLYRVLRALASTGIFTETEDRTFGLTPIAALLRSDVPNSMRDFTLMFGEDRNWQNWGELMHSVRTGGTAQEKVHGLETWEFFDRNAESAAIYNRAMTSLSIAVVPAIVEGYDFSAIGTLVDVAGGQGTLLAGILAANPALQGILFDRPPALAGADQVFEREGVGSRVRLVSGDFFHSVPAGADAYLMKSVIHDWSDECSLKILHNICLAINPASKVLIVETIVPEGNAPSISKIKDLQMLAAMGGKERTANEYRQLLEASGFRVANITPTRSAFSVIEAECAPLT